MTAPAVLLEGAAEWLEAARTEAAAGRLRVAFEAARHSAELSCKALLALRQGEFPKTHLVGPPVARLGLVPRGVDAKELHLFLGEYTLGTYGFERALTDEHVGRALEVAGEMLEAAEAAVG